MTEVQETEEKNAAGQDEETLSESSDNNEAEEADYEAEQVTGDSAEMEDDDDIGLQLEALIKESQSRREIWDSMNKENG